MGQHNYVQFKIKYQVDVPMHTMKLPDTYTNAQCGETSCTLFTVFVCELHPHELGCA